MLNLKKQLSCPLPKEKKHIFTGEGHKNHGAIFSCATGKLKICAEEITNKLNKINHIVFLVYFIFPYIF